MRLWFTLILSVVLASCAASRSMTESYLDQAEAHLARPEKLPDGGWQTVYRFIEDGLVSHDPQIKARAVALYKMRPEVKVGAAQSFKEDANLKLLKSRGRASATSFQRERLRMYSVVAGNDELKEAADSVQKSIDEFAKAEAAAAAAEAQARADAAAALAQARADAAAAAAKMAREDFALDLEYQKAISSTTFLCKDRLECEKAFALTQIYIATRSDMKIQMANDTVIETHNPTKDGRMGATAFKIPKGGTSAEIRLSLTCKSEQSRSEERACKLASVRLSYEFPEFLKARLMN